ncbi:MAG: DbpA RNA binding domain-containing protein [Pirellulales bacterium]
MANESGLSANEIGRIAIYEDHSTIDLLAGMPEPLLQTLKKVIVCGHPMNISRALGGSQSFGGESAKPFKKKPKRKFAKS